MVGCCTVVWVLVFKVEVGIAYVLHINDGRRCLIVHFFLLFKSVSFFKNNRFGGLVSYPVIVFVKLFLPLSESPPSDPPDAGRDEIGRKTSTFARYPE